MPIITIASSGKTTLTQIIVGTLAADGVSVVALDADPTGGLSRWAGKLYEGTAFACHHETEDARLQRKTPSVKRPTLKMHDDNTIKGTRR